MDLKNRTVLVSGGSSGIGLAIARILRTSGARVAITGRNEARLTASAREIDAIGIRADVTGEADVIRTFEIVDREQGENPSKLHADDIAHMVKSVLEMDDRGFTTELTVFATNPKD